MALLNVSRRLTPARIAWSVAAVLLLACIWVFTKPRLSPAADVAPSTSGQKMPAMADQQAASPWTGRIPLAVGLTVVSVAADRVLGDQHTITEVTSVSDDRVTLKVSMDTTRNGRFDGTLQLSRSEMARSLHYNKLIYVDSRSTDPRPGSFPGPSSRVMNDLKTGGNATFFDWRQPRTQARRFQTAGGPEMAVVRMKMAEKTPTTFPVLINGTLSRLPAIHAVGTLEWDVNGPLTN